MHDYIFWIQSPNVLIGVISDNNPDNLKCQLVCGPSIWVGIIEEMGKRFVDNQIRKGEWKIVTNPIEAFAIETDYKNVHEVT